MKIRYMYFLIGAAFGMMFPIGAWTFELVSNNLGMNGEAINLIHQQNKLLFMIDSAPLFLGLFAMIGGISKEKTLRLLNEFEQVANVLNENSTRLNSRSQSVLKDFNFTVDSLGEDYNAIAHSNRGMSSLVKYMHEQFQLLSEVAVKLFSMLESLGQLNEEIDKSNQYVQLLLEDYLGRVGNMNQQFHQVEGIGRQIDILSLNSTIEAGRYGEMGKAFGIVAQQIRNLAAQSKQTNLRLSASAVDIGDDTVKLKQMLGEEKENIKKMVDSSLNLKEIIQTFRSDFLELTTQIQKISVSSEEQSSAIGGFQKKIQDILSSYTSMSSGLDDIIQSERRIVEKFQFIKK